MAYWTPFWAVALLGAAQSSPDIPASTEASVSVPAIAPPADGFTRVAALTPIELEFVDPLDSKTSRIDQRFAIRVREAVTVDGQVVIPAGVLGAGEVVHAAKARALGKAGELILAARYLQCGTERIPLRGLKFSMHGNDRSTKVFVLTAVATPFAFLSGGDVIVPPGTHATAKLSAMVDLRAGGQATCPAPAGTTGPLVVPSAVIAPVSATATSAAVAAQPVPAVKP